MNRKKKKTLKQYGWLLVALGIIASIPLFVILTVKYFIYPIADYCVWIWNLIM